MDTRLKACGFDDTDPEVVKWWKSLSEKDKRSLVNLSRDRGRMILAGDLSSNATYPEVESSPDTFGVTRRGRH